MGRYTLVPLSYEALDYASGFASDQCPEGFCAMSKNVLRILTLERLGVAFNQQVTASAANPTSPAWCGRGSQSVLCRTVDM
jgi:splicing factor 3B subunit 3